jgi:CBS domain-containing protein
VLTAEGRLVGVVSATDLARAAGREGPDRDDPAGCIHPAADRVRPGLLVRDVMTSSVVRIDPDATIDEAGALMTERRVRWLAVVDERRHLVGVLSRRDLPEHLTGQNGNHPIERTPAP